MVKRKTAKRRTRRNKALNLLNLAEAGVIASIMTRNMAGTSLRNFITNENPQDGITLMELISGSTAFRTTSSSVFGGSITRTHAGESAGANWDGLWMNTRANAVPLIIGMIATPIIFRTGKRLSRKVLTPVRGLLKGTGVTV